jgi:hypothetical protein
MKGEKVGKFIKLTVIISVIILACVNANLFAKDVSDEQKEDRFVLMVMNSGEVRSTIVPAMVLDSYRGIIWTCHNLQDAKSSWVKTDLGQNGDKLMTIKKYSAKMAVGKDGESMLAAVLDNGEGIFWVCPNIVDIKSIWMKKDLSLNLQSGEIKNTN